MRKSQNFWDRNAGRYDCFMLKDAGILAAPTYTHADNGFSGKIKAFFMKLAGFPLRSKWVNEEYLVFLRENGWTVPKSTVVKCPSR